MKKMSVKRAQSILEYLAVSAVFATAGIATFSAAVQGTANGRAGEEESYYSDDNWRGQTLEDGTAETNTPEDFNGENSTSDDTDWRNNDETNYTDEEEE